MHLYVFTVSVMYEIISRLSGNQHVCVSHRPSLISAPPTVYTPHGCTLIPVYWAGFLILSVTLARSHWLSSVHLSVSVFSLSYTVSLIALCTFLCHPVISFPPSSHGKVFRAGSSSALRNMTLFYFSDSQTTVQYWHYCFLFFLFFFPFTL